MIDTLTISKKLQAEGFSLQQAEVLAQVVNQQGERLATKEDIKRAEENIKNVEERLQKEIIAVKEDVKNAEERLQKEIIAVKEDVKQLRGEVGGLRSLFITTSSITIGGVVATLIAAIMIALQMA